MYTASVTHQCWLWPAKFVTEALEGTVASEVGIPGLLRVPVGGNHMV
jgi:hypothetical protein